MKKLQFMAWPKLCTAVLLGTAALFTASCAKDGFEKESFVGTIKDGTVLPAPDGSSFKVARSADRTAQTVSWNRVNGAIDYIVTIYKSDKAFSDANVGEVVEKDLVVHQASVSLSRAPKTYYRVVVQTAFNPAENNPASETTTTYDWNSFVIEQIVDAEDEITTVLDGVTYVDFNKYLTQHKIEEAVKDFGMDAPVEYSFKGNVKYLISEGVDFKGYQVSMMAESSDNKPTIKMGSNATISTYSGLTLENINFDCDLSDNPFISLSKDPDESLKANGYYCTKKEIAIVGCNIEKLHKHLLFDNGKQYALESFNVSDCILHFEINQQLSSNAYIGMKNAYIKDFKMSNSTMWNSGKENFQTFIMYMNNARIDRISDVYPAGSTQSTIYENCTFYKLAYQHWANYTGITGAKRDELTIIKATNCIWEDCAGAGDGVAKRMLASQQPSTFKEVVFANNTYWFDGSNNTKNADYDLSGSIITTSPGLDNASDGDFTPSGTEQIKRKTGDPRWLK